MEAAVITLVISSVFGFIGLVCFICWAAVRSDKKKSEEELALVWSKLNTHLSKQKINVSSQMEVVRKSNPKGKILNLHIAIDLENKMFIFTKAVKKESFKLVSETLAFDTICGGELLVGGRSSSSNSFGSGVGQNTRFGSTIAVGSTTSTSTNYVHSIEYKIKTTDLLNPIYNVVICNTAIDEASNTYRHYMDVAIRLDTIIQQIIVERNK